MSTIPREVIEGLAGGERPTAERQGDGTWLDALRDPTGNGKPRHDVLRRVAVRLRKNGMARDEIGVLLRLLAERYGLPDSPDRNLDTEVRGCLEWSDKYAPEDGAKQIILEPRSLSGVLNPDAGKVPHLVDPLLPEKELSLLAAAWKSGKTLLTYQLILAAVFARKMLSLFKVPEPIPCVVYQLEMPGYEDDRRFRRVAIGMGIEPEQVVQAEREGLLTIFNRPRGLNLFKHPHLVEHIIEDSAKRKARLVVFDSLLALFAGLDFNDNSAVKEACDTSMVPMLEAGLTVTGLTHHSKFGMDSKTDDRVALLGAQAWGASAGRIYTLRRVPTHRIRRDLEPTEFYTELSLTGSWTPAALDPMLLNFLDKGEGTVLRAERSPADVLEESPTDRQERIVLTLLESGDLSKSMAKKAGVSGGTYDRVVQRVKTKGWVEGENRGRRLTRDGHAELDRRRKRLGDLDTE